MVTWGGIRGAPQQMLSCLLQDVEIQNRSELVVIIDFGHSLNTHAWPKGVKSRKGRTT
jgi:hypothetical protein